MLTVDLVRRGAARHATRTAVVSGDKSLTFAEVDAAANRMAHVLAGLGVARGARVGLLVGNGIWSVPADFGCLKAGIAPAPGVASRLHAETGGNPLALAELAAALTGDQLAGREMPEEPLEPGAAIRQRFAARLARLSPPARTALLVAAAAGRCRPPRSPRRPDGWTAVIARRSATPRPPG
jgi:non-ribosomal peptide synthetase component E (peptide arylation enzyme)